MTKDEYQLPQLPPLEEVLKLLSNQEKKLDPTYKKPTPEELANQLKEYLSKADLGKLVNALANSAGFERITTCPVITQHDPRAYSEIKLIKSKIYVNDNVVCTHYSNGKCLLQEYSAGILSTDHRKCNFQDD